MHEPAEVAKVACECGLRADPIWSLRPHLAGGWRQVEMFPGEWVIRGDFEPVVQDFCMINLQVGQGVWDTRCFCATCAAEPVHALGNARDVHMVSEHIYLATGLGKGWLEKCAPAGVSQTMSCTRDTTVAFDSPGRAPVDPLLLQAQHANASLLPVPRDLGTQAGLRDTCTVFTRAHGRAGLDVSTKARIYDIAGGAVTGRGAKYALQQCLGGYELEERIRSLYKYGPRLSEVVIPRELLCGPAPSVERVYTGVFNEFPAWMRWTAHQHQQLRRGLCSPCRREIRETFYGWLWG